MNIDFPYQSIEIDKEKSWLRLISIPIEINNYDWFIDCYRLLSIIIGKEEVQHLHDTVDVIESFSRDIMQFF